MREAEAIEIQSPSGISNQMNDQLINPHRKRVSFDASLNIPNESTFVTDELQEDEVDPLIKKIKPISARLRVRMSQGMYDNQDVKFAEEGIKLLKNQAEKNRVKTEHDGAGSDEEKTSFQERDSPRFNIDDSNSSPELSSTSGSGSTFYYQTSLDEFDQRVQIDWEEFTRCLLYHLFYPLSVPCIAYFDSLTLVKNYRFYPQRACDPDFFIQLMFQIPLILAPIIYFIFKDELQYVSTVEVLAPAALWFLHKVMVSTKYSMQSHDFLKRMRTEVISREQHFAIMLLSGWLNPSRKSLLRLLEKASDALLIDFNKMTFSVFHKRQDTSLIAPAAALRKGKTAILDDNEAVSEICVSEYCKFLAELVFDTAYRSLGLITRLIQFVLAIILAFTPEIVRIVKGHPTWTIDGRRGMMWFIVLTSLTSSFFFASTIISFDMVNVIDLFRRYSFLCIMKDLVDPLSTGNFLLKAANMVTIHIDLTNEMNLGSWAAMRELFLSFGLAFRKRNEMYRSYLILASCGLIVFMVISLLSGNPDWTLVIIIAAILFFNLLGIFLCIILGTMVNNAYDEVGEALIRIQYVVREGITATSDGKCSDKDKRDVLLNTDSVLNHMIELVKLEEKQASVKIFGIPITQESFRLLIAFLMTAATVIFYLYRSPSR